MKDLVTGKNKEQFEKWFESFKPEGDLKFYKRPFEYQIGVLLSYYEILELYFDICYNRGLEEYDADILFNGNNFSLEQKLGRITGVEIGQYKTLRTAYIKAFKKANEIVNNNLK